jgi:hypothetical protein
MQKILLEEVEVKKSNLMPRKKIMPKVNFTNILLAQLRQFPCTNKKFNLNFKHKKLPEKLSYKKAARKMLVKLTPSFNFFPFHFGRIRGGPSSENLPSQNPYLETKKVKRYL